MTSGRAQRLGSQRPVAHHVEQRADDVVGDAHLLADAPDVLHPAIVAERALLEDEQRRLHHAERVAQLVTDRADELTERCQPLRARVLCEEILSICVQHDRQLEVEDLADRAQPQEQLRIVAVVGLDDALQLVAEHVHRAEHVMLR